MTARNRPAVFIADLHLEARETPNHRAFEKFLLELCDRKPLPALFILGDLFNYWTGRAAEESPGYRFALLAMKAAVERGLSIALLRGNRDFLLDDGLKLRYGVTLVQSSLCMDLGGIQAIACHGDLLLIQDRANLRFRWVLRSAWVRMLQDLLPVAWVERIAANLRRTTTRMTSRKAPRLFEIPPRAVARLLRGGYDVLICGHVHEQSCRRLQVDGEEKTCYTLGAWEQEASVLEFDGATFQFRNFKL